MSTAKAKELRKNSTDAERALWKQLRAHRLVGYKFRRQQPVGRYVVDFVCFEKQVIVELDGGQHAEQVAYDAERTSWLQARGFRVLRFWNHETLQNIEPIVEVILKECERAAPSL
jgi:very-short-patch-repair endonuclease